MVIQETEKKIIDLHEGMTLEECIFHPENSRLLLSEGEVITDIMLNSLNKRGIEKVILKKNSLDRAKYGAFDNTHRDVTGEYLIDDTPEQARDKIRESILSDSKIRFNLTKKIEKDFEIALEGRTTNYAINTLSKIVSEISSGVKKKGKYLCEEFDKLKHPSYIKRSLKEQFFCNFKGENTEPLVNSELIRQFVGDETFPHGIHVAKLGGILAKYENFINHLKGIDIKYDIVEVTKGGILHDIGKTKIDDSILYSKKRFAKDSKEMDEIRKHPIYGMELLKPYEKELGSSPLLVAYEHHEKPSGRGYPLGKDASELNPYSRLIVAVDVFDALFFKRGYRDRLLNKEEVFEKFLKEIYGDPGEFFEIYNRMGGNKTSGLGYKEKDVIDNPFYTLTLGLIKLVNLAENSSKLKSSLKYN